MPSHPVTAAADEVGHLSGLTRSELAAEWVRVLKAAHEEELASGKRRVWDRVGQRDDVRAVLREFLRRMVERDEEREAWDLRCALDDSWTLVYGDRS